MTVSLFSTPCWKGTCYCRLSQQEWIAFGRVGLVLTLKAVLYLALLVWTRLCAPETKIRIRRISLHSDNEVVLYGTDSAALSALSCSSFISQLTCNSDYTEHFFFGGALSPFLTGRMFVRPNILRTLRRTMIRFLIELLVRRIWFGQSKLYFILNWLVMRCKLRPELAADAQQTAWSKM